MSSSEEEEEPRKRIRTYKKYKDPADSVYRPDTKIPKKPKPTSYFAPKRPMSAYFLYATDQRSNVRKNNSDLKQGEISKLIASDWNKISTSSKKKFTDKANKEMAKYRSDRAKYEQSYQFKKYKRDLAEWNECWKEEAEEQKYERKLKREKSSTTKTKTKTKSKAKSKSKSRNKNKNKNKNKK
eukprot:91140_1